MATNGASVRAAQPTDAAAVAAIYAPYVTDSIASFEQVRPSAGEIEQRMLASPRLPWLLAERSGVPVGYAYAAPHHVRPAYRWSVDCSIYLVAAEHGQGTGRSLYAALLDELVDLGYVTAFAGVSLPNPASVRFHESFGFEPVGVHHHVGFKFGGWHDVGWWQRPLRPLPAAPTEPEPWHPDGNRARGTGGAAPE